MIGQNSDVAQRFLGLKIPMFLGKISYSLYLVHVPVLLALVSMLHAQISRGPLFFLYVGCAISLATVFNILVEEPFIRLSHKVGRPRLSAEGAVVPV